MAIDLLKKQVGIVLAKRQLPKVVCEVKFALDISGSMKGLYQNGTVQNLADRLLAIASQFDDNGEMEVWTFTTGFSEAPTINESMHDGYIDKHIVNNSKITKWGATSYFPVMNDIVQQSFSVKQSGAAAVTEQAKGFLGKLFGSNSSTETAKSSAVEKTNEYPVFVPFITDGENDDKAKTEQLIKETANKNIYWMMVGIGYERFKWLQEMADKYPNVGFMKVDDLDSISDEDFYLQMLNEELCAWVKKFTK